MIIKVLIIVIIFKISTTSIIIIMIITTDLYSKLIRSSYRYSSSISKLTNMLGF